MDSAQLVKLSEASVSKAFHPEKDVGWGVPFDARERPALPPTLVSLEADGPEAGDSAAVLPRYELASMCSLFIAFENVLNANLARLVRSLPAESHETAYMMHVVEEEARHSRMFGRLVRELGTGSQPPSGWLGAVLRLGFAYVSRSPGRFFLGMLCVEEVTDGVIAAGMRTNALHPTVQDVFRIHRIEESRHMAYARSAFIERYAASSRFERALIRWSAPLLCMLIFASLVGPDVYRRAGVAGSAREAARLWWQGLRSPRRRALRHETVDRMHRFLDDSGLVTNGAGRLWAIFGFA